MEGDTLLAGDLVLAREVDAASASLLRHAPDMHDILTDLFVLHQGSGQFRLSDRLYTRVEEVLRLSAGGATFL
jgi:hypothetical protein